MDISCGIIITDTKKVLLGHTTYRNFWDIPKGHVEGNENYLECCLRELKEETGLDLSGFEDKIEELGTFKYSKIKNLHLYKIIIDDFNKLPTLDTYKCTTYFEEKGKQLPELDYFAYVDLEDIYKYTNPKMALLLCKLLNIPLKIEQKLEIKRIFSNKLQNTLINNKTSLFIHIEEVFQKVKKINPTLKNFTDIELKEIIEETNKNDFIFNGDFVKYNNKSLKIVDKNYLEETMPSYDLYVVSYDVFLNRILEKGITTTNDFKIYLSTNINKAYSFNKYLYSHLLKNYNDSINTILIKIDAKKAFEDGIKFYREKNDLVSCNNIPKEYLEIIDNKAAIINDNYFDILSIYNQS